MSADTVVIILLILLVITLLGGLAFVYLLLRSRLDALAANKDGASLQAWLQSTQGAISTLQTSLTSTLQTSNKNTTDTLQQSYQQLHERLDNAAKVIGELKSETGKFSEIGRSMHELQAFLTSPKLRGNLGERILTDLLSQVLPAEAYSLQFRFRSGDIVDAIIRTQAGLIPIDSKFPMENFNLLNQADLTAADKTRVKTQFINDVKKHIRDISKKYIRTDENTLDFALMYIPSEAVYYEITATIPELQTFAQDHRVLPTSPSTFYAFLRTIYVSFEGARIAKTALLILRSLKDIQKTSTDFGDHLTVLSKHLTNAYNNMNTISSEYTQLQGKINSTSSLPAPEEKLLEE